MHPDAQCRYIAHCKKLIQLIQVPVIKVCRTHYYEPDHKIFCCTNFYLVDLAFCANSFIVTGAAILQTVLAIKPHHQCAHVLRVNSICMCVWACTIMNNGLSCALLEHLSFSHPHAKHALPTNHYHQICIPLLN